MRFTSTIAAGAIAVSSAVAQGQNYLGFNTGATKADRSAKFKADFKAEFETAANLKNSPGDFNSARLYTNIQAYSEDLPIEAFDAAVETKTNLLLGVWASGTDNIDKEIRALNKAIEKHGKDLTDLVIGVTIGSEDLYRVSKTGVENESGPGNSPDAIVGFIDDWRKAFKSGPLSDIPVGHADTWNVWGNTTNSPVIDAVDFVAVHEYPYYENDKGNHIDNAADLFDRAYDQVLDAVGGKPVWVTETGWPYVGKTWDEAEASIKNAKTYWDDVGCKKLFNKTPTFWYTLRDSNPDNTMKFAITEDLSTTPRFDLTCPKDSDKDDDKDDDKKGDDKDSDKDDDKDSEKTGTMTASPSQTTGAHETWANSTMTSVRPTSSGGSGSGNGSDDSEDGDDASEGGNGGSGSGNGSGSGSGDGSGSGSEGGAGGDGAEGADGSDGSAPEPSNVPEGSGAALKVSLFGIIAAAVALF